MSHETEPKRMTLTDLADHCANQTKLYFHHQMHDPRYCFELFRRAVRKQDESAWDLIYLQYQPLVAGWVSRHSQFEGSGEQVEYFVNGAFAKIAVSLTSDKFDGFSEIGALLRYLKMCVHSVIMDYMRLTEEERLAPLEAVSKEASPDASPEAQALDRSEQQALWSSVNSRMKNDKERAVLYGSFVLGLKPQELHEAYPNLFNDIDEIYLVKQNIITRLRRDPEFRNLFGGKD